MKFQGTPVGLKYCPDVPWVGGACLCVGRREDQRTGKDEPAWERSKYLHEVFSPPWKQGSGEVLPAAGCQGKKRLRTTSSCWLSPTAPWVGASVACSPSDTLPSFSERLGIIVCELLAAAGSRREVRHCCPFGGILPRTSKW